MKKWLLAGAALAAAFATARATENGGSAYPNGAEDFMAGAAPPPGDYLLTYGLHYRAETLRDGNGDKLPIPFDAQVDGAVFRYLHVTKTEIAGANWAQHIFVPVLNVDVTTPGGSDSKFGIGDLIVDPVILAWHKPPFHYVAGLDVYVPVGAYDKKDIANVGRNYWTIEPVLGATYLNEAGYELSAKLMYDFNTENTETHYTSGDEFHFDCLAGMSITKELRAGINGFFYQQVTDDDVPAGGHNNGKGTQYGVGPALSYQAGPVGIIAKYQRELETENRPEGDRFWLKLIVPF